MGTTPPPPPTTKLPETETEKKFFQAIKDNNFQSAVNIILRSPDGKQVPIAELADEEGMSALHWAATKKNAASMRWLLDKKADVDLADKKGRTPLKIALDNKDTRGMAMLLDRGADARIALPGHDEELKTLKKTSEIVDFLIKTAAVDAKPPPQIIAPPPVNDGVTIEPAKIEPIRLSLRRTFGPQM